MLQQHSVGLYMAAQCGVKPPVNVYRKEKGPRNIPKKSLDLMSLVGETLEIGVRGRNLEATVHSS